MSGNFRDFPLEASSMILDSFPEDDGYTAIDPLGLGVDSAIPHQTLLPTKNFPGLESAEAVDFLDTALSYLTPAGSQELNSPNKVNSGPATKDSLYPEESKEQSPNSVSRTSSMVSGVCAPVALLRQTAVKSTPVPADTPKQPGDNRFEVHSGRVEKVETNAKKTLKVKKPSKYCHLCGHTASVDHRVLCRNIAEGTCRKTICRSCFLNQGWNFDSCSKNPDWECSHCRGQCPQRAQCTYYARTNRKRHMSLMMKKSEKGQDAAEFSGLVSPLALLPGPPNKPPVPAVFPVDMIVPPPSESAPFTSSREEQQHGDLLNSLASREDTEEPGLQISNAEVPRISELDISPDTRKGGSATLQTSELSFHDRDSWLYMF